MFKKIIGKFVIEAWNQPEGRGYGWAPCSKRDAERFFVFDRKTGVRAYHEFTSLDEAIRRVKHAISMT